MRALILAFALLLPIAAHAQQPTIEMVLVPRGIAETALSWIMAPNANNAVQLYAALQACIADNPHGGVTRRSGPDQCPAVTEALAAQEKALADATRAASPPPAVKRAP